MVEVTNELMYEPLKKTHRRTDRLENGFGEVKHEIVGIRLQALGIQTGINNIYSITARIDQRLELRELAEAQKPFETR